MANKKETVFIKNKMGRIVEIHKERLQHFLINELATLVDMKKENKK